MKKIIFTSAFAVAIVIAPAQVKVHPGGNVCIGSTTATPAHKLNVQTGDYQYGFTHTAGSVTVGSYISTSSGPISGGWLGTQSNHPLYFFTNDNNPHAMLATNGNFGIGTLTPNFRLQVGDFGDGTQAVANAWNTFSDKRLKKDVEIIPNSLDKIMKLNGYYYFGNKGNDQTKQVGVIAQEVNAVLPEIVHVDQEGLMSLDYSKLTALLINAIKDQQKIIDDVKTTLADLKSNNNINSSDLHGIDKINIQAMELANNTVLFQNYPNPFDEGTTINYFIPDNIQNAQIIFYDEFGNKLKEMAITEKGMGQLNIATANLASGVYSYSLIVNDKVVDTKKMSRVK